MNGWGSLVRVLIESDTRWVARIGHGMRYEAAVVQVALRMTPPMGRKKFPGTSRLIGMLLLARGNKGRSSMVPLRLQVFGARNAGTKHFYKLLSWVGVELSDSDADRVCLLSFL
jgi:hypothetical protein